MKPHRFPLFSLALAAATSPLIAANVSMTEDDAAGTASFNTAGHWDSLAAPVSGNAYFNAGFLLRTPADANPYTFAGDSLTISSPAAAGSDLLDSLIYKGTASSTITVNNLTFNGGTLRQASADAQVFTLAGNSVTVGEFGMGVHAQGPIIITAPVGGSGPVVIKENGATSAVRVLHFANAANTFTGNIDIQTASNRFGRFQLDAGSNFNFVIGSIGVTNTIGGPGFAVFNGIFQIDLTNASSELGDSWLLVNNATVQETFGTTFSITGFTVGSGTIGSRLWTRNTNGKFYQFSEATGRLTVVNPDTDGDGLSDEWETTYFANWPTAGQTNPLRFIGTDDPDGDGATNEQEETSYSDPTDPNSFPDDDGDGLKDTWERQYFGNITFTDGAGDPDGDLVTNLDELTAKTNPSLASSWPDADPTPDGMNDGWEVRYLGSLTASNGTQDSDGDGFTDKQEHDAHTDPSDSSVSPIRAALTHRWSFNGNLNDSVGSSPAKIIERGANDVVQNATNVTMTGGLSAESDFVTLGSGLIPDNTVPVTIELWATQNTIQPWSRIFDFNNGTGQYLAMAWTTGINAATDRVVVRDLRPDGTAGEDLLDSLNAPYALGTEYHIVMKLQPLAGTNGRTKVTFYSAPASAADLGPAKGTFETGVNLLNLEDVNNDLGFSPFAGDSAASASYNEFRMWKGAPTDTVLEALHDQGPDNVALPVDSDGDSLPDVWEIAYFANWPTPGQPNPLRFSGSDDPDLDGGSNLLEYVNGTIPNSDLSIPNDADADRFSNDVEIAAGSNPNDRLSVPGDINGDGIADGHRLATPDLLTNPPSTSFATGLHWDDGAAPVAGQNYMVGVAGLRTPDDALDYSFAGAKLVVTTGGSLIVKGTGLVTVPNLQLDGGILNNATSANVLINVAGAINVTRASQILQNNNSVTLNATLSGTGNLEATGIAGRVLTLNATNSWTGNLQLTTTGMALGATGTLAFAPGATTVTNAITGTGPVTLAGKFQINLGAAATADGSSWDLITTTGAVTYDPAFTVNGFTPDAGAVGSRIWSSGSYRFAEATGILSVGAGAGDGDALDDAWEIQYFGNTNQGDNDDFDSDGTSNLTEYRLGLIPNSGSSRFAATLTAGKTLQWPSTVGTTFRVLRSTNLLAGSWSLIGTVPGTAGTTTFTDNQPLPDKGFYRVELVP